MYKSFTNNLLLAIAVCCLMLSGCSNQKAEYTYNDLGIYDSQSQSLLKLGDSRETIEKYIGKAGEEENFYYTNSTYCQYGDFVYHNLSISKDRELEIEYDTNNIAVGFELRTCWEKNDNRFELPTGIKITSKVTDFQEAYPQFTENQLDSHYSSELHLKKNKSDFKSGDFNKDEYSQFKEDYIDEALDNYESILLDKNKYSDLSFEADKQWAYIIAEYYDYTEIEAIKIGYGWD